MRKNTDEIFIMTKRTGYIPHLKTYGPIPNPLKCPISLCMGMIIAGVEIYEYDPVTRLTMKLTLENLVNDDNFAPKEEKKVEVAPEQQIEPLVGNVSETVKVEVAETPEAPEDDKSDEVGDVEPDEIDEDDDETEDADPAPTQEPDKTEKVDEAVAPATTQAPKVPKSKKGKSKK